MTIITISGHYGSYMQDIASGVSIRLRAPLAEQAEILNEVAQRLRVPVDMVAELNQLPTSFLGRVWFSLLRGAQFTGRTGYFPGGPMGVVSFPGAMPFVDEAAFRDTYQEAVRSRALAPNVVFSVRGAQVILREHPRAFHVLITAPLGTRLERIMTDDGLGEKEALRRIRAADGQRKAFVKRYFGADFERPDLYDAVVNTDGIWCDKAVETILRMAGDTPSLSVAF